MMKLRTQFTLNIYYLNKQLNFQEIPFYMFQKGQLDLMSKNFTRQKSAHFICIFWPMTNFLTGLLSQILKEIDNLKGIVEEKTLKN